VSKKILIVDDEEDVRVFLKTFFEKEGFETVVAVDGIEALKLIKEEKPDLITLDLQMPRNTGTDFYRNIHRDKELSEIPVIVVSGIPGRHLAIPRPFAVFDKPIDREALLEKVNEAIGLHYCSR